MLKRVPVVIKIMLYWKQESSGIGYFVVCENLRSYVEV